MQHQPLEGVGIGFRRPMWKTLPTTERRVDWLEIITENFIDHGGESRYRLDEARERWGIGTHGVALSVGGPAPLDMEHLALVKRLLDHLKAPEYTEHLCWSSGPSAFYHDLLPLPFSEEAVAHTAARARVVADALERPLLLENISYYAQMPGAQMAEPQFVSAVLEAADCGLLLDVNNVWVNAHNFHTDAREDLLALPLHRTGRIHIAGHKVSGDLAIDNHGAPVLDGVLDLLSLAVSRIGPVPVLLEWDLEIPELDRVLDEADKVREVYDTAVAQYQDKRRGDAA